MSGDVFSAIDPTELLPAVYEVKCSIKLNKEVYCTYTGFCERDRVVQPDRQVLCLFCEYRKTLDIPEMIRRALNEDSGICRK